MRVATSVVLMTASLFGVCALPTSGATRTMTFAFAAPQITQRQLDARDHQAKHRHLVRKQRRPRSNFVVPFDASDDEIIAAPPSSSPAEPADRIAPTATLPAQVPICRETVDGVTIFRGRPCRG